MFEFEDDVDYYDLPYDYYEEDDLEAFNRAEADDYRNEGLDEDLDDEFREEEDALATADYYDEEDWF